jgi:hypothetical protein
MKDNRAENLKIIRLMNGTHEYTASILKSVVSNESLLSDFTNGKKQVSDNAARGIELIMKLPDGWLDRDNLAVINEMTQIDFELAKKLLSLSKQAKEGLFQPISQNQVS